MNKSDFKLVLIVIIIILFLYLLINLKSKKEKYAVVYYEDKIVLTINLSKKEKQEFDVKGYNGNVHIVAKEGKVKVEEENSQKNLCSKQGYISSQNQMIVCLPNKVIIKIENNDYDLIVG